jgi:hypothetical protein
MQEIAQIAFCVLSSVFLGATLQGSLDDMRKAYGSMRNERRERENRQKLVNVLNQITTHALIKTVERLMKGADNVQK